MKLQAFSRHFRRLLVLSSLLSALTIIHAQVALAQTIKPAQISTDISCDATPFGHVLNLGQENEVFMGFRNADAPNLGSLGSYRFDQDKTSGQLKEQAFVLDANGARNNISSLAGTTADLDGDGKTEFVQTFTDANSHEQIVVNQNGSALQSHDVNIFNVFSKAIIR